MSSEGAPLEEPKEEAAAEAPEVPAEGHAAHTPTPPLPPPPPNGEPERGPLSQCQAWLIELLDDVRYLITCTNWY